MEYIFRGGRRIIFDLFCIKGGSQIHNYVPKEKEFTISGINQRMWLRGADPGLYAMSGFDVS